MGAPLPFLHERRGRGFKVLGSLGREPDLPACKPKSRSDHVRRLFVAIAFFAAAVGVVVWLVSTIILRDLSENYVTGVLTQAQQETEGFLRAYYESEEASEGEIVEGVRGAPDSAIDPDLVLDGELPTPDALSTTERLAGPSDRAVELPPLPVQELSPPVDGRLPATLSTWGHEQQVFLNGELIERGALSLFHIKYPGGERRHRVQTLDRRDFDRAAFDPTRDVVDRRLVQHSPSSRPIMLAWDSTLGGEQVELGAVVDGAVLDEGIAELRAKVIPKLAWGGIVFVLLLVLAFFHVMRLIDRTRRVEAEAAEQARLAEVGTMAAGLAHEIRNPLNAVNMNLQLFEEDLQPVFAAAGSAGAAALAPEVADSAGVLRSVRGEIERLNSLVTDFLAYARPREPELTPRRMDEVVRECVELFQPMAEGAGVELKADLAVGAQTTLVDEAMIKQALTNVLVNAIDAVPQPGGHVQVTTRCRPNGCEIHVLDDGPGLPEEVEPLFRVFHSTKPTGFGLGLAISRSRVERHGGMLEGKTRPEGGAEFVITIPKDGSA
jgi:signal transduction histidine kinase